MTCPPRSYLPVQFPQLASPGNAYPLSVVARMRFHKRALRPAWEIALIIAKIFDHLTSLDEITLIAFLTASALSLSQLSPTLRSFAETKVKMELHRQQSIYPFSQ